METDEAAANAARWSEVGGEERRRRCMQSVEDSAQLLTNEITRNDRRAAGFFHHLNATLRAEVPELQVERVRQEIREREGA